MKKKLVRHKKINQVFTIAIFGFAVAIVAFTLPRERSFRYEFHKGTPWPYETYQARFDFPIYKTEAELTTERDSALKTVNLYFTYDRYQFAEKVNLFKENFDKLWIDYSIEEFKITTLKKYQENSRYSTMRDLQQEYHNYIYDVLDKIYQKGIVEYPETNLLDINKINTVTVVRGNIAEEKDIKSMFSLKQAYEYLDMKIQEKLSADKRRISARYNKFFSEIPLEDYLAVNVMYDEETTNREKNNVLSEISLTKGMVQRGERVISEGEIVTSEKYQILLSLKREYEQQMGNVGNQLVIFGRILLIVVAFFVIYMYLYSFRPEILKDQVKTTFILFMMILMLLVASWTVRLGRASYYVIPFAILPIILRTFYDERSALFVHIVTVLVAGFMAPNSFEFVFLNIIAGMVAIFSLTNLYRRSRFILSALLVIASYSVTYFGIAMIQEGSFSEINWNNFYYFSLNGILILLSFLLIYIFEKTFRFLSDTTLMELSDTNQPLLRKLAEVAPGTFQHSLQVANLSEEAIRHIGGNPLLVRTGALYHDIGKIDDPIYYIENLTKGINPHENLEFPESAKKIIAHVEKGVELAKKYKLPEAIIEFIQTHHGTTTVQYFYKSYLKHFPEKEVDVREFQYPGPRPSTKECAVLMMADAVEAASRSLGTYTEEAINNLVESIIDYQLVEGQFELADITYRNISVVKQVFKVRLKNIYHARISYAV